MRPLIRVPTPAINLLRAQLRRKGIGCRRGAPRTQVPTRVCPLERAAGGGPSRLGTADRPADASGPAAGDGTAGDAAAGGGDPVTSLLMTLPGIGPVTALSYRATVNDVGRFAEAGAVSAFFGLVPYEDSSAERQHRGRITKAGPSSRGVY